MQRWVLEKNGLVKGYLRTQGPPSSEEKHRLAFGAEGEGNLAEAGTWRLVPPELDAAGVYVGDDWLFNGTSYSPPVRP